MGAAAVGASWTGARFAGGGGGGFLAAAGAGCVAAAAAGGAGRGADGAAVAAGGSLGAAPSGGSGFMMLIGGVEAEVGNSALVGLPVGIEGGSPASNPEAACGGAFQEGA